MGAGDTGGDEKMTTRVVLPAYNEAESLKFLLPSLIKSLSGEGKNFHIYVVDDGSSDGTASQAKKFSSNKVILIKHGRNLGLAETINSGLRRALKDSGDDDIIVTMDADNSHLPGLINRMVRLIEEGHDIVISSRFVAGARVRGVPLGRSILSWGGSFLFKLLFPIQGVKDYTCGYRAYRVSLLKRAVERFGNNFIGQKGFSCMVDILLKLREFDPIITEVPMILRYDLKPGKSKMDVGRTIVDTLVLILRTVLGVRQGQSLIRIIWFLLIAVFLFSRIYNLERLPLFSDEGYAVARALELEKTGELFGMVKNTTQPIFIWLVALFQWLPFSPVVNGRLVSAVFGLGTALILAKLAAKWIGSGARIPAFILMAILPFSVFYDRTILFESTTLFFMALSLIFPMAIGLAVLTKQTGWLILPAAALTGRGNFKERWPRILISVLGVMVVWRLAFGSFSLMAETMLRKTAAPISVSANFRNNLLRSKLWLGDYLTWPVIWLSVLGGVSVALEALRQKKITPLLIIAGWTLGIFLFVTKTAVIFYPRYLYPIVLGIVLLATKGWFEFSRRFRMMGSIIVSILVLAPSLMLSSRIVLSPESANIPREDRFQFFEDWTSGIGSSEIADKIIKIAGEEEVSVYLEEENSYFITLKSDPRLKNARIETADWLFDPLTKIPEEILASEELSVFVRNRHPDIPGDWPVELIAQVPKTVSRSVYLYRITK